MTKIYFKISLILFSLVTLFSIPSPSALAQEEPWPPFNFRLRPSAYENGQITLNVSFSKQVEWPMADLTINMPLPEGTKFVEATVSPEATVTFNGSEITVFTSILHRSLKNTSFTLEVTNPGQTVFSTHAWIAWKGDHPGTYLTEAMSFDISRQPLDWQRPRSRLQLEVAATAIDDIITYEIYPKGVGGRGRRMWDLKLMLPIPENTTFISANAPAPFVSEFDGREVTFFVTELERLADVGPLTVQVSTAEVTDPIVVTHVWATWKNQGRRVVRTVELQEDIRSGEIVVQPHAAQRVVADATEDTPFTNYDLSSMALQEDGSNLRIDFYVLGDMGFETPLEYILYIDQDCDIETGGKRGNRGAEYWIRYKRSVDDARIYFWDAVNEKWSNPTPIETASFPTSQAVSLWIPYDLIGNDHEFCWLGRTRNRTEAYYPNPPSDWVGRNPRTTVYQPVVSETESAPANAVPSFDQPWINFATPAQDPPVPTDPNGLTSGISGRLAVPLFDQETGSYDVGIFSLPQGQQVAEISNARQPNFRLDGEKLLYNAQGGDLEAIYEYDFASDTRTQVSDQKSDAYPFYDPIGSRLVYGNPELTVGMDGELHPFLFVQCSLLPPHQEKNPNCQNMAQFGILVPAGQMGEIQGGYPVWTNHDRIAFRGCNTWAGSSTCGLYLVSAYSTKNDSDGFIPDLLVDDSTAMPTDTKGNFVVYNSFKDGNWEAYIADLDLKTPNPRNLSNHAEANDGLPTISPDGQWVAFVSDRGGEWAIWTVSVFGGEPQKLFTLPTQPPWNPHKDYHWTYERLSWGP